MTATSYQWAEDVVAHGLAGLKRLNGFFNENYQITHEGRNYLIRIKNERAEEVVMRQLFEDDVLEYLEQEKIEAPRLLYRSPNGFSIHTFIEGSILSDLLPKGVGLSDGLLQDIASRMVTCHAHDGAPLVAHQSKPAKDCGEFFNVSLNHATLLYKRLWQEIPEVYEEAGFPVDPLFPLREAAALISDKKLTLIHTDIHQHNLIITNKTNNVVIIDWEFAAVGDPVYDLATFINRSHCSDVEREKFIASYFNIANTAPKQQWLLDLNYYLQLEYLQSAITDVYRFHRNDAEHSGKSALDERQKRAVRLKHITERAHTIWQKS